MPEQPEADRPGLHQYHDTNGQFFLHHPFDADVVANTGPANSFDEVYWEDKLMPYSAPTRTRDNFQGGHRRRQRHIYRCPAPTVVRQAFVGGDGGVVGIENRTSYL